MQRAISFSIYSSRFSVYFPVTEERRGKTHVLTRTSYCIMRVRKLARTLSLADIEYHAAYTKTNFLRVWHFSALHACLHSKALQLRRGFAL